MAEADEDLPRALLTTSSSSSCKGPRRSALSGGHSFRAQRFASSISTFDDIMAIWHGLFYKKSDLSSCHFDFFSTNFSLQIW